MARVDTVAHLSTGEGGREVGVGVEVAVAVGVGVGVGVARAEVCEAAAAVEIAAIAGDARREDAERVIVIANQLIGMLTRLLR